MITMNQLDQKVKNNKNGQDATQKAAILNIKIASRHLWLNAAAYLTIFGLEYWLANLGHSAVLRADAFNNLSGIISTLLLMIGLRAASQTEVVARTRRYPDKLAKKRLPLSWLSRFRFQTVFTLVSSILMVVVAFQIIFSGFDHLHGATVSGAPQPLAAVGALIASLMMLVVWFFNKRIGRRLHNVALLASAQDSLGDALTSIGTLLSIVGTVFLGVQWLDPLASIVVGVFILYSGFLIFRTSSLNLVDYFDPKVEAQFTQTIATLSAVHQVVRLKAHYSGDLVAVDVLIAVDPAMTTLKSYELGEDIKAVMRQKYGVADVTVAVMPDIKLGD
ncbi:Co Zn Cd cation transporter [Agrilactobacillus composti DSM 18527 = JCM 14202]|uniref:Co Zn Cd cation transporter n=2 Tax=Agrilactobacillus TaxID=2767875 RepID=X0PD50_9LACO|nr:Co Zn Cd cation transporter [Agrilactobacillus composti DSM 18527 = JCM 14202]GAF38683.1 cobalt-zinc-cadmium resistance protein [Agrilactobacillus composti DSM 18527 = JCM 14202]